MSRIEYKTTTEHKVVADNVDLALISINISTDDTNLLELARYEIYNRLLPVIICMTIFGAIGIVGNILTMVFYSMETKRSPSRIQITALAFIDLMVCILIIPMIMEMVTNVTHNSELLCKSVHFLGHWMVAASSLILWVVAIERYRKICKPFQKQMTIKSTYYALFGCILFALLLSVRDFLHFELISVNATLSGHNQSVSGTICTSTSDPDYKISVLVFYGIDTFLLFICWMTIIGTYSQIALALFRLKMKKSLGNSRRALNTLQKTPRERCDTKMQYLKTDTSDIVSDLGTESKFASIGCELDEVSSAQYTDTLKRSRSMRKKRNPIESASERTVTVMMLTVSVGFVVCLLPYVIVKVSRLVLKLGVEYELDLAAQFALRLAYFNSVFNPVVYCCFNPRFRQYLVNKLRHRCC